MTTQIINLSKLSLTRISLISAFALAACGEPDALDNPTELPHEDTNIMSTDDGFGLTPSLDLNNQETFSRQEQPTRVHANCIVVEPGYLDFGSVATGAYHGQTVEVTNLCPVNVRIVNAGLSADSSDRFVIDAGDKSFIVPANKSYELEIGLQAYLGREAIVDASYRGSPIILRNRYEGRLDVVFTDVDQTLLPAEVWTTTIKVTGQADTQTSPIPVHETLDPRLQQPLKSLIKPTPESFPMDENFGNPASNPSDLPNTNPPLGS